MKTRSFRIVTSFWSRPIKRAKRSKMNSHISNSKNCAHLTILIGFSALPLHLVSWRMVIWELFKRLIYFEMLQAKKKLFWLISFAPSKSRLCVLVASSFAQRSKPLLIKFSAFKERFQVGFIWNKLHSQHPSNRSQRCTEWFDNFIGF